GSAAVAGGYTFRGGPRAFWRDHGGESGAGHGDAAIRCQPVCRVCCSEYPHRTPGQAAIAIRWRGGGLPDAHHLRARDIAVLERAGVRVDADPLWRVDGSFLSIGAWRVLAAQGVG